MQEAFVAVEGADGTVPSRGIYDIRCHARGDAPGNAEIGKAAERTGQWVAKWAESETAPRDFEVHTPVTEYLLTPVSGREVSLDERWLFRAQGDPPHPELWKIWINARRSVGQTPHVPVREKDRERNVTRRPGVPRGEAARGRKDR